MSRTVSNPNIAVASLRVVGAKVCGVQGGDKALVAYSKGKANNRCIAGMQKKYNLSAEFSKFAILEITNTEAGDLDEGSLSEAKTLEISFNSKGRGYSGVMERHNFGRGPANHGSRFHRRRGSISNREWPGRVQPNIKMAGHYGNAKVGVKNEFVPYDAENKILVLKGAVPGFSGTMGKVRIVK